MSELCRGGSGTGTYAETMLRGVRGGTRDGEGRADEVRPLPPSLIPCDDLCSCSLRMTTTSKRLRSTSPPVFVDQRTTAPIQPPPPRTQKAKRARASLPASETVQVTALESCRLPLADADVRYRPGFVSKPEANDWYEQLCHVDGCE